MGRSIAETKNMKDFSSYNIPELMGVSTDELQELSFEEFGKEVSGKRIIYIHSQKMEIFSLVP